MISVGDLLGPIATFIIEDFRDLLLFLIIILIILFVAAVALFSTDIIIAEKNR